MISAKATLPAIYVVLAFLAVPLSADSLPINVGWLSFASQQHQQAERKTQTKLLLPTVDSLLKSFDIALRSEVAKLYEREFGETILAPAVFSHSLAADCFKDSHITSTAYIRDGSKAILKQFYLSHGDLRVIQKSSERVIKPAGRFRTLVAIVGHAATVDDDGLALFAVFQQQINEDHLRFARIHKQPPLVQFENTTIVLRPSEFDKGRDHLQFRAVLRRKGLAVEDYQFVIGIDPDPYAFRGARAIPPDGDIYVGNFGRWTTLLREPQWKAIANIAYHHEIAHHWGWKHDWTPTCGAVSLGFEPFVAPPTLFGWEDTDDDGVPEITDDTPYGRPVKTVSP